MAFGFVKKTWKDRISEYPTRRTLTKEDGSTELVTVSRSEGTVSQEGDAFSADNMNDLETRVDNALTEANSNLNVRYNEETDSLDAYSNGNLVGSLRCGFSGLCLYNNGDEKTSVTGGYEQVGNGGTFVTDTESMSIKRTADAVPLLLFVSNLIDLTNYNFIEIEYSTSKDSGITYENGCDIWICNAKSTSSSNRENIIHMPITSKIKKSFDISNITGSHYIGLAAYYGCKTTITYIRLYN